MKTDQFQGDPLIQLTQDGAEIPFLGGQPIMDQGLENQATLSLFTLPNWWGNALEPDADKQIGSEFEIITSQPITREMLKDVATIAQANLESPAFGSVDSSVQDFGHGSIAVKNVITPPGGTKRELLLNKNGQNWINQAAKG